jgi:multiple sugar transport system permease protein
MMFFLNKLKERDPAGRLLFFAEFKKMIPGYLFILPAVLIISIFVFMPIVASLFLSFTQYNVLQPPKWVGLNNYYRLIFEDRLFWIAVRNTLMYVAGTVPIGVALSLLLAVWVDSVKLRFMKYLFRTIYFLPTITAIVAISVVWKWLYAGGTYGLINFVLVKMGIPPVDWLTNPKTTLPAIMLMSIWGGIGYNFIIFLAGLQGIPRTIYEAAEIDGASGLRNFWHITLPLLRPAIVFVVLMSVIGSFQVFDQVYILTQGTEYVGGVLHSALTIVTYLYERGFERFEMGYASAIAYMLFLLIFVLTLTNLKFLRLKE